MGSFERCRSLPEVRLVTLVGEPGLGKTRLTAELRADARPGAVCP